MSKILPTLCIAAAVIAACNEQEMKTDTCKIDITESLADGRKDSVTVSANIEFPISGLPENVIQAFDEIIVGSVFGSDYAGLTIQKAADKWAADFVDEYKKEAGDLLESFASDSEKAIPEDLGSLNWENKTDGYFSGSYKNVISYTTYSYVYTGGAHGSTTETSVNLDLKTGKQVTEKDFFIPGYEEDLATILRSKLRDAMPDQEAYDALFIKDIEPNGNFKVSEQGLTYVYGQYEIGPYYLGIIKVTIPWIELGDLVRN